jgi:hypothetical protein
MNNINVRKKAKLVCIAALSLLFLWLLAARGLKLTGLLTSSAAYQDRIVALGPVAPVRMAELAGYLDALRQTPPTLQSPDSMAPRGSGESGTGIASLRESLRAAGIRGERLRLSGKAGNESAELTLRCETAQFFSFLAKLPEQKHSPVNYLSIRAVPGSRETDITMRFKYE